LCGAIATVMLLALSGQASVESELLRQRADFTVSMLASVPAARDATVGTLLMRLDK
jgi:hypothetical protein